MVTTLGLLGLLAVFGCSEEAPPPPAGDGGGGSAAGCEPGQRTGEDGDCIDAGVLPEMCAEGFVHDGDVGCEPVLPAAPCVDGLMAVPGEETCHPVAPCGDGPWGDIPLDGGTVYVDQSYAGGASDGGPSSPWTTIEDGIAAAPSGALIAVAAGSYAENVVVDRPVRLWGRCPDMVEIAGGQFDYPAVTLAAGAGGSVVRGVALTGAGVGLGVLDAGAVTAEQLWVHDTDSTGVEILTTGTATSMTLRDSLIERSVWGGIFLQSTQLIAEHIVVRGTEAVSQGSGRGIGALADLTTMVPAELSLSRSVIEGNVDAGIFVGASNATLVGVVVRDTQMDALGSYGRGIAALAAPGSEIGSVLSITGCLVEANREIGIDVSGSRAHVEGVVVRDNLPSNDLLAGRGLSSRDSDSGLARGDVTVIHSLFERSVDLGVWVANGSASLEGVVIRNTTATATPTSGVGVSVISATPEIRSSLVVTHSVLDHNIQAAVLGIGADLLIDHTLIRDVGLKDGSCGRGVMAQMNLLTGQPAVLTLRSSRIEQTYEAGIFLTESAATIDHATVVDTRMNGEAFGGDGIVVVSQLGLGEATVTHTHVADSARAGLSVWGGRLAVGTSTLSCQSFDLNGDSYEGVAHELIDLGGNACGCPEATGTCKAVSASLVPPQPLADAP